MTHNNTTLFGTIKNKISTIGRFIFDSFNDSSYEQTVCIMKAINKPMWVMINGAV